MVFLKGFPGPFPAAGVAALLFHRPLQHRTAFSYSVGWFLSANLTSENQVPPSISGAADFGAPRDSGPALLPSLEWLDHCPRLLTRQLGDRHAGGAQAALRVSLPAGTCCIALHTTALFCHRGLNPTFCAPAKPKPSLPAWLELPPLPLHCLPLSPPHPFPSPSPSPLRASRRSQLAETLSWDLWPPEPQESKCSLFQAPSLWIFVTSAPRISYFVMP